MFLVPIIFFTFIRKTTRNTIRNKNIKNIFGRVKNSKETKVKHHKYSMNIIKFPIILFLKWTQSIVFTRDLGPRFSENYLTSEVTWFTAFVSRIQWVLKFKNMQLKVCNYFCILMRIWMRNCSVMIFIMTLCSHCPKI